MTIIWLIVWLIHDTPAVHDWNGWMVALVVCIIIDVLSVGEHA